MGISASVLRLLNRIESSPLQITSEMLNGVLLPPHQQPSPSRTTHGSRVLQIMRIDSIMRIMVVQSSDPRMAMNGVAPQMRISPRWITEDDSLSVKISILMAIMDMVSSDSMMQQNISESSLWEIPTSSQQMVHHQGISMVSLGLMRMHEVSQNHDSLTRHSS